MNQFLVAIWMYQRSNIVVFAFARSILLSLPVLASLHWWCGAGRKHSVRLDSRPSPSVFLLASLEPVATWLRGALCNLGAVKWTTCCDISAFSHVGDIAFLFFAHRDIALMDSHFQSLETHCSFSSFAGQEVSEAITTVLTSATMASTPARNALRKGDITVCKVKYRVY